MRKYKIGQQLLALVNNCEGSDYEIEKGKVYTIIEARTHSGCYDFEELRRDPGWSTTWIENPKNFELIFTTWKNRYNQ